jgi:hypothetical protein
MSLNVRTALKNINTESALEVFYTVSEVLLHWSSMVIASFFMVGWSTYVVLLLKQSSVFGTGSVDAPIILKHFLAVGLTPLLLYRAWLVLKNGFYGLLG